MFTLSPSIRTPRAILTILQFALRVKQPVHVPYTKFPSSTNDQSGKDVSCKTSHGDIPCDLISIA